jgi:hypothetical protein
VVCAPRLIGRRGSRSGSGLRFYAQRLANSERMQTDKAFLIATPMRKAAWTKRFAANGPPRPLPSSAAKPLRLSVKRILRP